MHPSAPLQSATKHLFIYGIVLLAIGLAGCQSTAPTTNSAGDATVEEEMPARAFFVQVGMADTRAAAESTWQAVAAWWNALDTPPAPLRRYEDPPARVVWKAPMYRVRVGPLASRSEAEVVQAALRDRFSDAFIARGTP